MTIAPPTTQLVQQTVFEDDATAKAAMAGVYIKLADGDSFADGGYNSVTLFESLYGDELVSFASSTSTAGRADFYFNNVTSLNSIVSSTWTGCYKIIYECNRILEGINASSNMTSGLKQQLSGEAKFIRAFCHFYLVNLYGDVPLITSSDYTVNTSVLRTPVADVYKAIITDLLEAKALLTDAYPSTGKVRVNKGAATALLARIFLYSNDFANAETQATEVISTTSQYKLLNDLEAVFDKNSDEAIWQLLPKGGLQSYTNEGSLFILVAPPSNWSMRNELYESFETADLRRAKWINSISSSSGITTWHFAYKYKENQLNGSGAEYSMVLRLAEQYLIRAEARAKQDKLTGANSAESDINTIRSRAGLTNTTALTKEQLLAAVEQERRVELFTEWGHRFFDLKRTGRLDAIMKTMKTNWNSYNAMLPLPQSELLINTNLKQNAGYQ